MCQNSDDKLALLNSTANGPQWMTLDANPIPGTGLAFNLVPGSNNTEAPVISYQTANQGLCSAGFSESSWTVDERNPISELSTQAPLAGFTWNESNAQFLDIVSTGQSGITVNYFNSSEGNWTSVQSPRVMAQVQNYSAIAANAASHVYAFQDGDVKEYQLAPGMAISGLFLLQHSLFRVLQKCVCGDILFMLDIIFQICLEASSYHLRKKC